MKYLYYSFIFLIVLSCSKSADTAIKLTIFNQNENIDYSKVFNASAFIPLETRDECLIGYVQDVCFFEDEIYILDGKSRKIYQFDKNGGFRQQIGSKGKGAGEYLRPVDIFYSKLDDCLKVYDSRKRTIFSFKRNGNFIGETKISVYCRKIEECGEFYYGYVGSGPYENSTNRSGVKAVKLSMSGKLIKKIKGRSRLIHDLSGAFCKGTTTSDIFFTEGLDYSLYMIHNDKVVPFLNLDFDRMSCSDKLLEELNKLSAREVPSKLKKCNCVYSIRSVLECDNKMLISFMYKQKMKHLLCSKKSKKLLEFFPAFLKSQTSAATFINPIMTYNNNFVEAVAPSTLFYLKKQKDNSVKRQIALNNLCEKLDMNSNPVLVIHQLKID